MVWIIGLLVWAYKTTNKAKSRRLCLSALLVFYFFGNYFTVDLVSSWWNYESITVEDIDQPYDLGIVLTGYAEMNPDLTNFDHFLHFNQHANRLTQSIELYKMGKVKKLLISGGSGHLIGEKHSEGEKTRKFLVHMGIEERDIFIESESRNTIENARLATQFVMNHDLLSEYKRILLLTSDFHMYRSKKSFDKAGLNVVPFCLGNQNSKLDINLSDFLPHPGAISYWHKIIKEWAAIVVYKILGYI